ncbi:MAG: hypothetical protein V4683_17640 [Bacteroidota bacterium]
MINLVQNINKMATIEQLRSGLIENIQSIKNKDLLVDLSNFVALRSQLKELVKLSKYQKMMLEMSEEDLKYGRTISHEELMKKNEAENLNEYQILMIEKGLDDIKNGRVKSNKEVMENADKWLNSK